MIADNPTVTATVLFQTDAEISSFASWWINDLDFGYKLFNIELKFFGITKPYVAKIKNNLTDDLKYSTIHNVKLTLEIVESIIPMLHIPLIDDLNIRYGVGEVDFSRASTATYIDKDTGLLSYAEINEPRFEKDGLLIEGDSTNLMTRSDDTSNWSSNTSITLVSSTELAPDNTNKAGKFVWGDTIKTSQNLGVTSSVSALNGETFTQTVFVKPSGFTWIRLQRSLIVGTQAIVFIDLINGAIGTQTNCSATIEKVANGYFRVSMTFTMLETASIAVVAYQADGNDDYTTAGDGVKGYYFYGTQLEKMPFATSYIPTTTTAVTRTKDKTTLQHDGNMPSWKEPHSIFATVKPLSYLYTDNRFVLTTGLNSNGYINLATYGIATYSALAGGVVSIGIMTLASMRVGGVSDGNTTKGYFNGVLSTDTEIVGTYEEDNLGIYIGMDKNGSNQLFGHLKNIMVYGRELIAEEAKNA